MTGALFAQIACPVLAAIVFAIFVAAWRYGRPDPGPRRSE